MALLKKAKPLQEQFTAFGWVLWGSDGDWQYMFLSPEGKYDHQPPDSTMADFCVKIPKKLGGKKIQVQLVVAD